MLMIYLLTACIYTQTGHTPLSLACFCCLSDVAQLLINKGANIDVTDEVSYHKKNILNIYDVTALHIDMLLQHM